MGDLVEITTIAKQQHIFYRITSGSLRFQVRGSGDAGISLSRRPCRACKFWIVMRHQGSTVVLKGDKQVYSVPTPQILSIHAYREFWIHWYDNIIALGKADSEEPFLVYNEGTFGLNYIAFASIGQNVGSLQWRFEMPPVLEKVAIKPISGGVLEWKPIVDDQLPDGAVIGGYEEELVYIIRAKDNDALIPGKYVPSEGKAYIPWERYLEEADNFEVLCGYNCIWVPCSNGKVPIGAVEGGHSGEGHEIFYIGRALYENHLIPGRIQPSDNVCYMATYDFYCKGMRDYEVLVVPDKNMHYANTLLMDDMRLHETVEEDAHVENSDDNSNSNDD